MAILKVLKFPLKLLAKLVRKRPKRTEREQKQRAYIRNFDPTRLKNRTWQKSLGKYKKKKKNNKKPYRNLRNEPK
ncbi:MAG: hypothetical protein NY202_03995 [Mollicutes bacterium UO1]